jgi:hypothetical protein
MDGGPLLPAEPFLAAAVVIATWAVANSATAVITRPRQGGSFRSGAGGRPVPLPVPVLVSAPAGLCSAACAGVLFLCLVT